MLMVDKGQLYQIKGEIGEFSKLGRMKDFKAKIFGPIWMT